MLFWLFEGRLIHIERYDMQIDVKLLIASTDELILNLAKKLQKFILKIVVKDQRTNVLMDQQTNQRSIVQLIDDLSKSNFD